MKGDGKAIASFRSVPTDYICDGARSTFCLEISDELSRNAQVSKNQQLMSEAELDKMHPSARGAAVGGGYRPGECGLEP